MTVKLNLLMLLFGQKEMRFNTEWEQNSTDLKEQNSSNLFRNSRFWALDLILLCVCEYETNCRKTYTHVFHLTHSYPGNEHSKKKKTPLDACHWLIALSIIPHRKSDYTIRCDSARNTYIASLVFKHSGITIQAIILKIHFIFLYKITHILIHIKLVP